LYILGIVFRKTDNRCFFWYTKGRYKKR